MDEKKSEEQNKKEQNQNQNKVRVGTVGEFILIILAIIIIGTGAFTYYLIHREKDSYENLVSNLDVNLLNAIDQADENVLKEVNTSIAEMINSVITNSVSDSTNSVVTEPTNTTKKTLNEELVVLYDGLVLDTSKMDKVALKYIDNTKDAADKYVITYYNYENYSFKNSSLGTISSPIYEGLARIDNVGKIAISEDYNAIPREVKVVNTVPTVISDANPKLADYDTVKTMICDLDGNQTNEYILILANKTSGFSKISLFDAKGVKVADLASIEKSKWKTDVSNSEYYLSISNVQIIDVDNDGIMEVLVEIPYYEGEPDVSILKYKNGELQGKTNIECSLLP